MDSPLNSESRFTLKENVRMQKNQMTLKQTFPSLHNEISGF